MIVTDVMQFLKCFCPKAWEKNSTRSLTMILQTQIHTKSQSIAQKCYQLKSNVKLDLM